MPTAKRNDIQRAADDLRSRTLARFERSLDRLIYLASTRDYNTGVYYHDGLAASFGQDVACQALADCHREAFRQLIGTSVENLVHQLEAYIRSLHTTSNIFISAWTKLEPYRVAVPVETDALAAEFLFSNLRTALAILGRRQDARPGREASA